MLEVGSMEQEGQFVQLVTKKAYPYAFFVFHITHEI